MMTCSASTRLLLLLLLLALTHCTERTVSTGNNKFSEDEIQEEEAEDPLEKEEEVIVVKDHNNIGPGGSTCHQLDTNRNGRGKEEEAVFVCDAHQCIAISRKCNGVAECSNGADESVWECGCLTNEFFCNGTCIDLIQRCDTRNDCPDQTDEQNCETFSCFHSYFKCDNHLCIPDDHVCNFVNDCGDNSDEHNCERRKCWYGEFRCLNGQCIRGAFLCDGTNDCIDGSDETQCDLKKNLVECGDGTYVHETYWCDDTPDCKANHADELNCRMCTEDEFRCSNSRCIATAHVCDGVCDCFEECDDERDCRHNYRSINGIVQCLTGVSISCYVTERCVAEEYLCDGRNDCQNGDPSADEYGCRIYFNESISPVKHEAIPLDNFPCPDGRLIPASLHCDFKKDCLDGYDELGCNFSACNNSTQFSCDSGECIHRSLQCNTIYDCKDWSDEFHCERNVCDEDYFRCQSGQCIPDSWLCDYRRDCSDGSDETDCPNKGRICSDDEFQCVSGQCVPETTRCQHSVTERYGCADGSHLLRCKEWLCRVDQFKCRNSYCIDARLVCNGKIECTETWTDEDACPFPCSIETECQCQDVSIDCTNAGLPHLPRLIEQEISRFLLSGNYLNETLGPDTFHQMDRISFLDLSNNSLNIIQPLSFQHLRRLKILHLNDNYLNRIQNTTFFGLGSVTTLNLKRNVIVILEPFAFYGLSSLKSLDLSRQKIVNVSQNAFIGLRSLHKLDLSYNRIAFVQDGCLNGMPRLLSLDLSHNDIHIMGSNVFHGLNSLQHLVTDEFRFCCLARATQCQPHPDEFSSCEDLMSNLVLRICVWILGLVAFVGNILVIIWRIVRRTSNKVHSFLITNLAVADMFMGAYLLVIATIDARYRGVYFIYDSLWRQSSLCQMVGFVSTFSSELSVFTLTVITLDRFVSIIFPFRLKRLEMKHTRIVMSVIWIAVLLLAGVPLLHIDYFQNFYGRSGVCLALHITHEKPSGWEYSVFVFLALNLVSFSVIAISYLWMYAIAKSTHRAVHSPEAKRDNTMAKRMTLIVFTDFCCWMPIIILGVISLSGAIIPPQVFAWIAVFVLPLNAAVNPVLYTLSTAPFLGPARKRVSTFRHSFMTSISGDTHRTVVSTTFGSTGDEQCNQSSPAHIKDGSTNAADVDEMTGGEIIPLKELASSCDTSIVIITNPTSGGVSTRKLSPKYRKDRVKFDKTNSLYN